MSNTLAATGSPFNQDVFTLLLNSVQLNMISGTTYEFDTSALVNYLLCHYFGTNFSICPESKFSNGRKPTILFARSDPYSHFSSFKHIGTNDKFTVDSGPYEFTVYSSSGAQGWKHPGSFG